MPNEKENYFESIIRKIYKIEGDSFCSESFEEFIETLSYYSRKYEILYNYCFNMTLEEFMQFENYLHHKYDYCSCIF